MSFLQLQNISIDNNAKEISSEDSTSIPVFTNARRILDTTYHFYLFVLNPTFLNEVNCCHYCAP